jgi:DNA primase
MILLVALFDVGAVGRLVGPGDKRYHNYFEFPAGRSIGGANVLGEGNRRVLVVEGFFDVMNAHQHLFDRGYDTICTWRAEMTQEQADLIIGLDKTPIICYDMDVAGEEGWSKSKMFLGPYTTCLKRARWEDKELDFGDMSPDQLTKVLSDVHSALF